MLSCSVHEDSINTCSSARMTLVRKINILGFHQTVLLAFPSPSLFFPTLSTNSNTLCCTKWMGLLCWSLFSSFESYSSLTSTTSMEGMSFFPSLFCWLAELAQPLDVYIGLSAWRTALQNLILFPAGMHPSPSTWFPCQCPGIVILVPLCSWHPSSTGSP